jgi:WD40 repeat protein/3',5'-cyclic AMP phosphodiesterase CpdA
MMHAGGGPDRWPWLARLWRGDSSVGAGFLVDDGHVLTCAHVVADALGPAAPAGQVVLDFPEWSQLGRLSATVEAGGWFPVQADESGDLAVLRLDASLPEGMVRAPLRSPASVLDHRFRCHGFPPEPVGGREAVGVLRGPAGPGWEWTQLEAQGASGYAVERGFSGAPVWDDRLEAVVGMVVAQDPRNPSARVAWMIPVDALARHWRPLTDLVLPEPARPAAGRSLTLLHLADLRFGGSSGNLLARLAPDLRELGEGQGVEPALVVVSGDLSDHGLPSEFEQARRFLEELRGLLGLPARRLVVVPGNHDVNRTACAAYFLRCEADQSEPTPPYWPKWEHYATLLRQLYRGEPSIDFPVDEPWTLFEVSELGVAAAGLNSTMAESHRVQDHYGRVGQVQLLWFADRMAGLGSRRWFRIGVVHHSVLKRGGEDRERLRDAAALERILVPHLDLLLHGHTHGPQAGRLGSGLPVLSAGSAAPSRRSAGSHYQVIRIQDGSVTRWARRYDPTARKWRGETWTTNGGGEWRSAVPAARALAPKETRPARAPEPAEAELESGRDDFLARVAEVCRLREPGAEVTRVRPAMHGPEYLRVTVPGEVAARQRPVGGCEHGVTPKDLDDFAARVHDRYHDADPVVRSELVYGGEQAPAALVDAARRRGIHLVSFMEYQGILDLRRYGRRLQERLRVDPLYPPGLYVPQRYVLDGGDGTVRDDLLGDLVTWLSSRHGRFALVLGSFGAGKTFLLRELARRLPDVLPDLVPVLIPLGALQKSRTLEELVALHLAGAGEDEFSLSAFRYMLREGRIALLFDGYDELALRVTYDRAAEHLETLLAAAEGRAKVVVTSRTQHFVTDQQVRTALGSRVDLLPGRRVVQVLDLDQPRIRDFLVKHFGGDQERADRWFGLIAEVRDLPELSKNPRLLSFMAGLDEERFQEIREQRAGISAAELYRLLLQQWLEHEHVRAQPPGALPTLSVEDRWRAATRLALDLWRRRQRSLPISELTASVAAAVDQLSVVDIDVGQATHAVGSGTLLVRDEEGAFRFVHRSVMEWLVASVAASPGGGGPDVLGEREISPLMAEFFCDLAGRDRAVAWARGVLAARGGAEAAKANALLVLHLLQERPVEPASLAGQGMRGADLSGRDLSGADLRNADLGEAMLVGANLRGARLGGAVARHARLDGADLRDADLREADLSGARLLGADLRGALLAGSRWRRAALLGATLDPDGLGGLDSWGAVPPDGGTPEPLVLPGALGCESLAVSPDSELIAVADDSGVVGVWDAESGRLVRSLEGQGGRVLCLGFSRGGRWLASGGDDRAVRMWDAEIGRVARTLKGHDGRVRSLTFSPDGRRLASGAEDGTVRVWDAESGKPVRRLEAHDGWVQTVGFSPDGGCLMSGGGDGRVRLWEARSGRLLRTLEGHGGWVQSVAFSPDGRWLASGPDDGVVRVWEVDSGRLLRRLEGHTDRVRSVSVSPAGRWLASGADDGVVRVWDAESGKLLRRQQAHRGGARSVSFSPDGRWLASGGADRAVRIWDADSGKPLRALEGHRAHAHAVSCSPDGRWLASAGADGAVKVWDADTGRLVRALESPGGRVLSVSFGPGGRSLATGGGDGPVKLWDRESGRLVRTLEGHYGAAQSVSFGPDGRWLASGGGDGVVRVWEAESGRLLRTMEHHGPQASAQGPGPVQRLMRRWHRLPGSAVQSVSVSADGRWLASGDADGAVKLWDAEEGHLLRSLEGHPGGVQCVAFSPDARWLASGGADGAVRVWEAESGKLQRTLEGHTDGVRGLAFSPDGRWLASGGVDRVVRLWEVESGTLVRSLEGHGGWVHSVAFGPGGRRLCSCGSDGAIRLWDPSSGALRATLPPLDEGWACLVPGVGYKLEGSPSGRFWYVAGLCRFEPGELDGYAPIRRLPADAPIG